MDNSSSPVPSRGKTILVTGLIAGALDISAAILNYVISTGKNPVRIFYYIASAVFGKGAYDQGLPMAFVGLLFHFTIALSFTWFFFFCYPKIKILSAHIIVTGLLYGIFVWAAMTFVILRLTRLTLNGIKLNFQTFLSIVILMVCVGLPVALMADRFYKRKLQGGSGR